MSSLLTVLFLLLLVATTTNQVFAKNICTSTLPSGEHPNWIGQTSFQHMTNRGVGNYNVSVLLCWARMPPDSCGLNPSYISITNESAGCVGNFDVVLQRPTVAPNGFKVKYGSKTSPRDMAEIMVVCNPNISAIPLISRSQKFAKFSPNKLGGTTFMMVTYSYAACATNQPTSTTATQLPTTELPSGGSSDMPSGGSGSMPSGGSGSMPSGGSGSSDLPSGGSSSSGSGNNGDNCNSPLCPRDWSKTTCMQHSTECMWDQSSNTHYCRLKDCYPSSSSELPPTPSGGGSGSESSNMPS